MRTQALAPRQSSTLRDLGGLVLLSHCELQSGRSSGTQYMSQVSFYPADRDIALFRVSSSEFRRYAQVSRYFRTVCAQSLIDYLQRTVNAAIAVGMVDEAAVNIMSESASHREELLALWHSIADLHQMSS